MPAIARPIMAPRIFFNVILLSQSGQARPKIVAIYHGGTEARRHGELFVFFVVISQCLGVSVVGYPAILRKTSDFRY